MENFNLKINLILPNLMVVRSRIDIEHIYIQGILAIFPEYYVIDYSYEDNEWKIVIRN